MIRDFGADAAVLHQLNAERRLPAVATQETYRSGRTRLSVFKIDADLVDELFGHLAPRGPLAARGEDDVRVRVPGNDMIPRRGCAGRCMRVARKRPPAAPRT